VVWLGDAAERAERAELFGGHEQGLAADGVDWNASVAAPSYRQRRLTKEMMG
jgi:hypothetical protein